MKKNERISINEGEKWGGLCSPEKHLAAFGARFADNSKRDFGMFGDRMTLCGEKKVASFLQKFVLSKKTLALIKNNTKFVYGGDASNYETEVVVGKDKDISVRLQATCRGEYCYVRAYADPMPSGRLGVVPTKDKFGELCWQVTLGGRSGDYPRVYAPNERVAMDMLLDHVSNELDGREDIMTF